MIEWLAGHGVDRGGARLRLPARRPARGARGEASGRGSRIRYVVEPEPPRHRRRDPLRRRRARRRPRRALPGAQRRRAHRPRPDRAAARPRASAGRGRRSACTRSRTPPPTAWSAPGAGGEVLEFLEKTGEAVPGEINAGMYVLERSVLDLIPPGEEVSIERDVFPRLVGDGPARAAAGRLLDGHRHARALPAGELGHPRGAGRDAGASRPRRGCWSAPAPRSASGATIGPRAVLGPGCRVGAGAEVRDSVLLDGCVGRRGRRGSAARSSRPGSRWRPGRARRRRGRPRMKESPLTADARRRPRHPRPPARRPLAGRIGAARAGRGGRPAGLRDGRLGDRRRPRRGGARRPPHPARCSPCAATSCRAGRRRSGPCSAPATRATPRRRSPASPPPEALGARRIVASTGGALVDGAREAGRAGGRPARHPAAARRGRLHARRRRRGRRPGRRRAAHPHRDRRRRRLPRGAVGRPPGARRRDRRPSSTGPLPGRLRRRPDRAGRPPLEDPDQRERQAARLLLRAARGRPQRALRLGRRRRRRPASRPSCSRTPTSTRASAAASS